MVWSLLIREMVCVTDGRHFVALCYVCTLYEDSCHRKINSALLATEHHCNTVEPLFNEESVTFNELCNLCTDGARVEFGVCKGDGNFMLSSVWRILASEGCCQRSWLCEGGHSSGVFYKQGHLTTYFPTRYAQILAPSTSNYLWFWCQLFVTTDALELIATSHIEVETFLSQNYCLSSQCKVVIRR